MAFGYDTDMALRAAAALANSEHAAPDGLSTVQDLADFVLAWGWTGTVLGTPAELRQVRDIRAQVRSLWAPDEHAAVERVNVLLHQANAVPQLVKHDEYDWHLHATPSDAPLATRMVVEAARHHGLRRVPDAYRWTPPEGEVRRYRADALARAAGLPFAIATDARGRVCATRAGGMDATRVVALVGAC